jgi:DNA-binding CsgD family transcriptional regulator/tetratricopeptide (TPR) repeat protein
MFVGRACELTTLERALAAAHAGSGATVLVAGEAGIGKTRLAAELATRSGDAGFVALLGRSIDFAGVELPYQPLVEALRPIGALEGTTQLRVFENALAMLAERSAAAPVLLVLEDLHWADASTLDLVVFLAHNLDDRRILLLGTYRADEPGSARRMRRLAEAVHRSGSALLLELGPLDAEELAELLATRADAAPPAALTNEIVARAEGNPFFAEELLAAARDRGGKFPRRLRDLLLQRVAGLDGPTQGLLRVAAAAGRDVSYGLVRAIGGLPERDLRAALRSAVEHGVLVPDQATGSFRFRHALLAEAVYATILPGEREDLHGRIAEELAGSAAAGELAPHWAAAGRRPEALATSLQAAREAEAVFGLAEERAHLERALALWPAVPAAVERAGLDLAGLCAWTAELAAQTGAAPYAVELVRRAIELVEDGDAKRAALLHECLGRYLFASGRGDAALAAFERAVQLVPAEPPSPERAQALAALGNGLMLAWRYEESLVMSEQALAIARGIGDRSAEVRAVTVLGTDLAYLGRGEEGLAQLRLALRLALEGGDRSALQRAYVDLTDVLLMLGRPRESARTAEAAVGVLHGDGLQAATLFANWIEALVAGGEWDAADRVSAAAIRAVTANYPHHSLITRAELEVGRGDFDAARPRLEAAHATLRLDRDLATYATFVSELALWERRWADVEQLVGDALPRAATRDMAQIRVWLCAKGLRAQAEIAALARARHDAGGVRGALTRAQELLTVARRAADESSAVTPNAAGWLALAEAEHTRAAGVACPQLWSGAAQAWDRLERPPLAAYCRWRQAEAMVAAGAPRSEAVVPLRAAHAVARRLGARPLLRELELLAERARLDPAPVPDRPPPDGLAEQLGLTAREAEVLALVARGLTNREIAAELVISAKTASVHVSHILHKLDAPNRREAAAIAHRAAPPGAIGAGAAGRPGT